MDWTTLSNGTGGTYELQNSSNSSNSTDNSCHTFSAKEMRDITIIKAVLSSISVAMCLVAVIVILALRQFHTFVHRLVLYMLIVAGLHGVTTALHTLPLEHNDEGVVVRDGYEGACAFMGFIVQLTLSQLMLILMWILAYLFLLVVCKYPANSKKQEIAGLVISLGLPLLVDWLPLMHDLYGLAGAWCWIRVTDADCNDFIVEGVVYQVLLFYGPKLLVLGLSFVMFIIVAVILTKKSWNHSRGASHYHSSPYQQAVKETLPLLLYPILYDLIVGVMIANRIDYAIAIVHSRKPYYPLFVAHATCDSLRTLFLSLGFLLHPGTMRKLLGRDRPKKRSEDSVTNYPVPPESFTDVDPLVIRGTPEAYSSSNYKSILDVAPIGE